MSSEMGRRPMIGDADNHNSFGDEFHNEMGLLLREERRQDADELEQELNLYRSGSAPPTVEGSLSAVGGLFNHVACDGGNSGGTAIGQGFTDFARNKNGNGFSSEEELRSDPNYLSYYYSNVNLNPRLPPPLLSREDWRFAQRLQGGSSAIGDRRKVIGNDSSSNGGRSMFSMPPGFKSKKLERENEDEVQGSGVEWSGDGLIGLPGLGLGGKQKSIVEIFQEDLSRATPASAHPSRPSSRNTFAENAFAMGSVEAELANVHQDLVASTPTIQTSSAAPAMYSYAAALGGTLSRSSTPDPQRIARAPSPCSTPIGGCRTLNSEKRTTHSPDLVVALSGMSLSTRDADDRTNYLCNLDGGHNNSRRHAYHMKKNENLQFSNSSPPSITTDLGGPHLVDNLQYQHLERPDRSLFSNYGLGGYPVSPLPSQLGSSNLSTHSPFMDTLYLQYLRAAEYAAAAAQVAAINDPSVDMNYMGNSYTNLIQKAYQKSQYGASSPHGYYMNPSFDIGLQYPGSPMGSPGPIMRASGSGPGSPLRHVDMNMRFPGAVRNVAGGVIGPWHLDGVENAFASSLLEEFKSNKTRCFELLEIAGHVVEFSADQYGSRFIQQKLETATTEEKNMVFQEIFPQALALMTDVFGNYVIQKFFEHGMMSQRRELAGKLFGHVLNLSLQMYGCRVIQKAIEVVDVDQKIKMVEELDGHVMRCVRDQNGNHVIQKCIECVPEEHIQFIVSTFFDQVVTLSTHPYGCRVIQRVLEHCKDEKTQNKAMEEILGAVSMLAQDQYGNYVVQHVLEHGKPHERSAIIQELAGKIVPMSQQKFASNVVEKCLTFGDAGECQLLVNEMLGTTDENEPLQAMMKDQFANYVVQKVLETCSDQQRELIMSRIKVHLNALKRYTYGKHIVARVEKLVAAGERRIAAQTQQSA